MDSEFDLALNTDMWDFIGSRLSLFEPTDRKAFTEFSAARVSNRTVTFSLLIVILNLVYMYSMIFTNASTEVVFSMLPALLFTVFLRIPVVIFLSIYRSKYEGKQKISPLLKSWIPFCESFTVIASTITIALMLMARVYNGKCHSLNQLDAWKCNSEFSSRALPQEFLLVLMINPVVNSIVYKSLRFEHVMLSWFIVIATLLVCVIYASATQSLPAICTYIPTSLLLLFENHRQDLILFFVVKSQKKLLVENKRMSDEMATEMRHMIANVAHDLKTPLSAFMNGVETVKNGLESIKEQRSAFYKERSLTDPFDDSAHCEMIDENIKNLINTNDFMTMTINRCIDYTKASKGIKLDPRLETINLMDIVSLPVQIMKDMQSRIAVNMLPLPTTICSHIMTDKQWLQENLFCLISNAVKYSGEGIINVTTSLTCSSQLKGAKKASIPLSSFARKALSRSTSYAAVVESPLKATSSAAETVVGAGLEQLDDSGCDSIIPPIISSKSHKDFSSMFKKSFKGTNRVHVDTVLVNTVESFSDPTEIVSSPKSLISAPLVINDVLLFEVEDTGIGLSDEMMSNLFTPFKQAQRRAGGTGLGLYSLAKRLEALGGNYGVRRRSDGKEGSVFWFAIPYSPDFIMQTPIIAGKSNKQDSDKTAQISPHSPSNSPPMKNKAASLVNLNHTKSINVLIVDDSLTILKMSSMLLRRQGHTVTQAENGAEALKKIAAASSGEEGAVPFDIVLMDLNMPVMDGLEATSRLRALEKSGAPQSRHQFVVGFSANSDHETMVEGLEAGMDDFISKPFALQTFQDVYDKHMGAIR